MGNPLQKRYKRELRQELGKYLVILVLMVTVIGFVSGFLVADSSMIAAYQEGFTKYQVEDGYFTAAKELVRSQRRNIEAQGVTLTDLYYKELPMDNGSNLRVYADRTEVNTVCLMKGELPTETNEIAIDRMYADNNHINVGDTLTEGARSYTVSGFVALPDYSCLFENNSDSMFDATQFGVGVMTEAGFAALSEKAVYNYAWRYAESPADTIAEKAKSDDLMKEINGIVELKDYIPRYQNQAITFTGEDMGSDKAMTTVLLYIVMVILAFVFGLTTSDTITKEAAVIGTLRATGYSRGELIRHYMVMPTLVTAVGAVIGNILGYTVMKEVCASMYYGSYSLPTYVTVWSAEAFWKTTLVPILLMLVINFAVLSRKLRLEPLQFLRKNISRQKKHGAWRLSHRLPIMQRMRLRILSQNAGSYLVMFIGIVFANLLLMFGLIMHPILMNYQNSIEDNLLSKYQYFLAAPKLSDKETELFGSLVDLLLYEANIQTENPDAEKFSAYALQAIDGPKEDETITLYGIEPDSRYVHLSLAPDEVYISKAYADKFGLHVGDSIRMKEKYEDTTYSFTVDGIYDYMGGLTVFLPRKLLNQTFDLEEDYFGGYFSDTEITDIPKEYIDSVLDLNALTKISRQLETSMGSMMYLIEGFSVLIFLVIIYLLSKVIIEKNSNAISMTKILGYSHPEIRGLYVHATSIVVVLSVLLSVPIEAALIAVIWQAMMSSMMSGWLPFILPTAVVWKMVLIGIISYAVIAVHEFRKIQKIPMTLALKDVE